MSDIESYALILIVEPDEPTLSEMLKMFRRAGYHTAGTSAFEGAREQIQLDPPRVLLTAPRLGTYSGVHLALVAKCRRTDCRPIILVRALDPVLEREANEVGAVVWVKPDPTLALPPLIDTILGRQAQAHFVTFGAERRRIERRRIVTPGFTPERRVAERRSAPGGIFL